MIRGLLTILSFISVIFFPWFVTALLVLISSFYIPLLPLSIGLFADTLYYTPNNGLWPLFTIYGIVVTVVVLFVRSRLKTSSIGG